MNLSCYGNVKLISLCQETGKMINCHEVENVSTSTILRHHHYPTWPCFRLHLSWSTIKYVIGYIANVRTEISSQEGKIKVRLHFSMHHHRDTFKTANPWRMIPRLFTPKAVADGSCQAERPCALCCRPSLWQRRLSECGNSNQSLAKRPTDQSSARQSATSTH